MTYDLSICRFASSQVALGHGELRTSQLEASFGLCDTTTMPITGQPPDAAGEPESVSDSAWNRRAVEVAPGSR